MSNADKGGWLAWAAIVGPVIAALTLAFATGFCTAPWDTQSRNAASLEHRDIRAEMQRESEAVRDELRTEVKSLQDSAHLLQLDIVKIGAHLQVRGFAKALREMPARPPEDGR